MHLFDLQHTVLAKHAQHVVLVHFPVALVVIALLFDLIALRWRDGVWAAAAYYNLSVAAAAALPVAVTGLLAWRWQLEGAPLRGVLRLHLLFGLSSCVMICVTWWVARRSIQTATSRARRLGFELATVLVVALTAHLGGFVSGINM
jgi:uncharacterized membrane protein